MAETVSELKCNNCSSRLISHGVRYRKREGNRRYRRYRCPECGAVSSQSPRSPYPQKFSELPSQKKQEIGSRLTDITIHSGKDRPSTRVKGILSQIEMHFKWNQRKTMRSILLDVLENHSNLGDDDTAFLKKPEFLFNLATTQSLFLDKLSSKARYNLLRIQSEIDPLEWDRLRKNLENRVQSERNWKRHASARKLKLRIEFFYAESSQPNIENILSMRIQ